jgi:hypothetical protein
VPKVAGIGHLRTIAAFKRAGFRIVRQGKHVIRSDGNRRLVIPCANPKAAITMGAIARDAGLGPEQFRELLWRP